MRIQKKSTLQKINNNNKENIERNIDADLNQAFQAINGRLRLGDGTSGLNGENISGQWQTFTTTTANTEVSVTHTVGAVPVGFIVTSINVGGVVYNSGTAWTSTNAYFKCSAANATITVFLLR